MKNHRRRAAEFEIEVDEYFKLCRTARLFFIGCVAGSPR